MAVDLSRTQGCREGRCAYCFAFFVLREIMGQIVDVYYRNRMLISVNKYKFVDKNKTAIYS